MVDVLIYIEIAKYADLDGLIKLSLVSNQLYYLLRDFRIKKFMQKFKQIKSKYKFYKVKEIHGYKEFIDMDIINMDCINWFDEYLKSLIKLYYVDVLEAFINEFKFIPIDYAAAYGQLDTIKWLHARNAKCTNKAMDNAAKINRLDIVIWLHNHRSEGCTTDAMDYAAEYGYLELFEWLYNNRTEGCTIKALTMARKYKRTKILDFMYKYKPAIKK